MGFRDEQTALRLAAELAMECGMDEDAVAVGHFKKKHYAQVVARYVEKSPRDHVLAVQAAPLMNDDGGFIEKDLEVGTSWPCPSFTDLSGHHGPVT